MNTEYEPCSICELYICGYECHNDKCPVAKMKAEVKRLKWERDSALKHFEANREVEQREHNSIIKELEAIKGQIPDTLSRIKAEAIREFAEKLNERKSFVMETEYDAYVVDLRDVDELAKELMEEQNES